MGTKFKVVVDFRRGPAWTTTLEATDDDHAKQMARAMAPENGFTQPIIRVAAFPTTEIGS